MKNRSALIFLSLLLVASIYYVAEVMPRENWALASDGTFSYPESRGNIKYEESLLNDTENFTLSKIIYESKGEKIYALLRMPKNGGNVPAMVMLPGAQVTKEGQQLIADFFQENGFATLTLDERGNTGETQGGQSMDAEYASYASGKEPASHKMVFDALRAFDILRGHAGIDKNNIGFYGESMGGRFAIIAAALEPSAKFLVAVSTSGYGSGKQFFSDEKIARFYASIDPDSYIGRISPRRVIIVHAARDATVPIEMAKATFSYANEPKKFIEVNSTCHGLCGEMKPELIEEVLNAAAQ